jgi:amidophosphoribosyltransferase
VGAAVDPDESADRFHDECGVVGIWGHADASNLAYLGLYAMQHRGQESAGIASWDGSRIHSEKAMGHVAEIFDEARLARLPGRIAIGHVRYSTTGDSRLENAQPIVYNTNKGPLAIGHNGNLVNADEIKRELEQEGSIFTTSSDTEVCAAMAWGVRSRRGGICRTWRRRAEAASTHQLRRSLFWAVMVLAQFFVGG